MWGRLYEGLCRSKERTDSGQNHVDARGRHPLTCDYTQSGMLRSQSRLESKEGSQCKYKVGLQSFQHRGTR